MKNNPLFKRAPSEISNLVYKIPELLKEAQKEKYIKKDAITKLCKMEHTFYIRFLELILKNYDESVKDPKETHKKIIETMSKDTKNLNKAFEQIQSPRAMDYYSMLQVDIMTDRKNTFSYYDSYLKKIYSEIFDDMSKIPIDRLAQWIDEMEKRPMLEDIFIAALSNFANAIVFASDDLYTKAKWYEKLPQNHVIMPFTPDEFVNAYESFPTNVYKVHFAQQILKSKIPLQDWCAKLEILPGSSEYIAYLKCLMPDAKYENIKRFLHDFRITPALGRNMFLDELRIIVQEQCKYNPDIAFSFLSSFAYDKECFKYLYFEDKVKLINLFKKHNINCSQKFIDDIYIQSMHERGKYSFTQYFLHCKYTNDFSNDAMNYMIENIKTEEDIDKIIYWQNRNTNFKQNLLQYKTRLSCKLIELNYKYPDAFGDEIDTILLSINQMLSVETNDIDTRLKVAIQKYEVRNEILECLVEISISKAIKFYSLYFEGSSMPPCLMRYAEQSYDIKHVKLIYKKFIPYFYRHSHDLYFSHYSSMTKRVPGISSIEDYVALVEHNHYLFISYNFKFIKNVDTLTNIMPILKRDDLKEETSRYFELKATTLCETKKYAKEILKKLYLISKAHNFTDKQLVQHYLLRKQYFKKQEGSYKIDFYEIILKLKSLAKEEKDFAKKLYLLYKLSSWSMYFDISADKYLEYLTIDMNVDDIWNIILKNTAYDIGNTYNIYLKCKDNPLFLKSLIDYLPSKYKIFVRLLNNHKFDEVLFFRDLNIFRQDELDTMFGLYCSYYDKFEEYLQYLRSNYNRKQIQEYLYNICDIDSSIINNNRYAVLKLKDEITPPHIDDYNSRDQSLIEAMLKNDYNLEAFVLKKTIMDSFITQSLKKQTPNFNQSYHWRSNSVFEDVLQTPNYPLLYIAKVVQKLFSDNIIRLFTESSDEDIISCFLDEIKKVKFDYYDCCEA